MKALRKFRIVLAAVIVNFPLCLFFVYGNLSTYMYSYFYFRSKARGDSIEQDMSWVLPTFLICRVVGAFPLDFLKKRLGLRKLLALGILLYNVGIILTFYASQHSVWATILTLMVSGGLGNVAISLGNLMYVADWFEENIGVASSLPFVSASLGGMVLNQVVTIFINPENQNPDTNTGRMVFFSQPDILDRVPLAFLLFGGLCLGIQMIGFCFYQKSTPEERKEKIKIHKAEPRQILTSASQSSSRFDHQTTPSYTTERATNSNPGENSLCFKRQSSTDSSGAADGESIRNGCLKNAQKTNHTDKTPFEVVKSETFYILSYGFMAISFSFVIISNYFKLFGELWISDDSFLATIGSVCSLSSAVVQISTGYCVDRFGIKRSLIAQMAASSLMMCIWYFTALLNRWIFFLWTVALFGVLSNQLNLFSLCVLKCFGTSHYAGNVGMVSTATLLVYFGSPVLIISSLEYLGWFWLFFISSVATALSLLQVVIRLRV